MALFLVASIWRAWPRAADWAMRRGFYVMCMALRRCSGSCWEFLKPYPRLIGPFNLFHRACAWGW
jgi:phosphatidylglycerol:prolipoprotein diacylglycerol transferase